MALQFTEKRRIFRGWRGLFISLTAPGQSFGRKRGALSRSLAPIDFYVRNLRPANSLVRKKGTLPAPVSWSRSMSPYNLTSTCTFGCPACIDIGKVGQVHGDCTLQFDCADENGDNDEPLQLSFTHALFKPQGRLWFLSFSPRFTTHDGRVRSCVIFGGGAAVYVHICGNDQRLLIIFFIHAVKTSVTGVHRLRFGHARPA